MILQSDPLTENKGGANLDLLIIKNVTFKRVLWKSLWR